MASIFVLMSEAMTVRPAVSWRASKQSTMSPVPEAPSSSTLQSSLAMRRATARFQNRWMPKLNTFAQQVVTRRDAPEYVVVLPGELRGVGGFGLRLDHHDRRTSSFPSWPEDSNVTSISREASTVQQMSPPLAKISRAGIPQTWVINEPSMIF